MARLGRTPTRLIVRSVLQLALLAVLLLAGWALISHFFIGEDSPLMRAMTSGLPVTIVRAVDGDTIVARVNGRTRRVRVLGIDSPESVKPNSAVEPCGVAASDRAKAWVRKHRSVRLERDPAAPDEDRYGRLLRYVEPTDGTRDLSTVQVTAGLAQVKTYGQDLARLPELRRAQSRARSADRGLWGDTCSE